MTNQRIFIRQLLYSLKREYGQPIDLYTQVINTPTDITTGKKDIVRIKYYIPKAVVVPVSFNTAYLFTQTYLKNIGREFAFGGTIDRDIKNVIIDARDLPVGVEILPEFHMMIHNERYDLGRIQKLEENAGYLIQIKRVTGTPPNALQLPIFFQNIRFRQIVTTEVN